MVELRGERVVLRPLRTEELDGLYDQRLRSEHTVGKVNRDALEERIAHSGEWFAGRLDLGIETDRRLVGTLEARVAERCMPPGICELGIELFDGERGKGLGAEAIQLLAGWLLGHGYPRVQASTDLRNAPMRRVFEKLGWEFEGVLRAFMPDGESRADYALYSLTRK